MSCTVSLLPFLLIGAIADLSAVPFINNVDVFDVAKEDDKINLNGTEYVPTSLTSEQLFEKKFETNFVDKQLLMKTLREHGATNCAFVEDDSIYCDIEGYHLNFKKENEQSTYIMTISCPDKYNAQAHMNDLNEEYTLNVQEESYTNIVDGLKAKNLEIESEEVLDDDSIVITVNLE